MRIMSHHASSTICFVVTLELEPYRQGLVVVKLSQTSEECVDVKWSILLAFAC